MPERRFHKPPASIEMLKITMLNYIKEQGGTYAMHADDEEGTKVFNVLGWIVEDGRLAVEELSSTEYVFRLTPAGWAAPTEWP